LHTSPSSRRIGVKHAAVARFSLTDKISDSNSEIKADDERLAPAERGLVLVRYGRVERRYGSIRLGWPTSGKEFPRKVRRGSAYGRS